MAHTIPQDVRDRYLLPEPPLPADAVLETHIDDAEDAVLSAVPDLEERLADGRIPLDRLKRIVSRMVIRHVSNPGGLRQVQETTGPYNSSQTWGGDEPGEIYVTKRERRQLLGIRKGKAFMIDTTPSTAGSTGWC